MSDKDDKDVERSVKAMSDSLFWFSTTLITISFAVGICVGLMLGRVAMVVAVLVALVGTVAVHKFTAAGKPST